MGKLDFKTMKSRIESEYENYKLIDMFYKLRSDKTRNELRVVVEHECGKIIEGNPYYFKTKGRIFCPKCENLLLVSKFHAVVATLFESKYDNVEHEYDIGFKGVNNGVSKYDLYVPNYKGNPTVFEFQSRFHDNKKDFDKNKKQFAINKGYKYIALDHRDKTISEFILELFGENIDYDTLDLSMFYKKNFNFKRAQDLLNQYNSIKEVSSIMDISYQVLKGVIKEGLLILPDNHLKKVRNLRQVVQLSLDGEYLETYCSRYEVFEKTGLRMDTKHGEVIVSKGYIWLTLEDYEKQEYTIPLFSRGYTQTFVELNENNKIVKRYNSLSQAREETGIAERYIKNVLLKKQDRSKGRKFMFLREYNEINK